MVSRRGRANVTLTNSTDERDVLFEDTHHHLTCKPGARVGLFFSGGEAVFALS